MNKKERLEKGFLKLGEIAKESGLSLGTVRHYSNLGLITPDERTQGNFRLFKREATHKRLGLIKKLISRGFTLEQIHGELLKPAQPKEVLIVDDEKEVGEVIQELLKDKKVSTKVVYDGFTAGEALGKSMPDLIILDLHLPGVDGFEICRQVKQKDQFGRTKILAITGYDSPENAQKIFACGADAYLAKPFDINELISKIDRLLEIS